MYVCWLAVFWALLCFLPHANCRSAEEPEPVLQVVIHVGDVCHIYSNPLLFTLSTNLLFSFLTH